MFTTLRRSGLLALALAAGAFASAGAQLKVDAEASTFAGGTWFLTQPPRQFAIQSSGGAEPLFVQDGTYRKSNWMAGVSAGFRFDDHYGLEGFFAWIPTRLTANAGLESQNNDVKATSMMWGGNVLYHFTQFETVQPFVGVGVGGETMSYGPATWNRHTGIQGNGLVGANVRLAHGVALRLDARDCLSSWETHITGADNTLEHDLMLSAGLSFRANLFDR